MAQERQVVELLTQRELDIGTMSTRYLRIKSLPNCREARGKSKVKKICIMDDDKLLREMSATDKNLCL